MLIGKILKLGLDKGASDIIFTAGEKPALKVNGDVMILEEFDILTKELAREEILGIMNTHQVNEFNANLELDFSIDLKDYSRFRVNAFSQKNGFGAVFRPITENIKSLDELGLCEEVKRFKDFRNGLVLITGPVGSGKSTTMAALLESINREDKKHIITVEDPIEFVYENRGSLIEQREVGSNTHSFNNGLKYALRQAPDVILVGEMRDLETFRLALRAAETGNLVLATLHTSGCARTVSRIIDMFPGDEKNQVRSQLAESLKGVIWQNLLKTADGKGRVASCEVMVNNREVSNMIRKDATHQINNAIETGTVSGMLTMKKSLEGLYGRGVISEEVYDRSLNELLDID